MYEQGIFLGLFAETSLHPGTGSTTGIVDLPIQRERHTGFPTIQASGLKGAMREVAEAYYKENGDNKRDEVDAIFGPEESDYASSLAIADARILAFPARSLSEVYVWVTCPAVISRLKRDANLIGAGYEELPDVTVEKGKALAVSDCGLGNPLVLEEFSFELDVSKSDDVKKCVSKVMELLPNKGENDAHSAVRRKMKKHLIIIGNEDFKYLVNSATQVSARIKLNDKKTTTGGGGNLWYEESLPPDCLFYTLLLATKPRVSSGTIRDANDVLAKVRGIVKDYIQIAGNETVGMGWCSIVYNGGA